MSDGRATISMGKTRKAHSRSSADRMTNAQPSLRSRPLSGTGLCMALLALAMILGGGGTSNPQTEMVLEALTAVLIIPLVVSSRWQVGLGPVPAPAWILAFLVLLLPVLQLIPLPPSVWHSLPGRAVEVQSLALAQADQSWMPMTMAPARTFASLLAMICPVLVMLQVARLSLSGRTMLCAVIVSVGLLSLLLGVLQLSRTGGWDWSLYTHFNEGFLVGFQANRNAEADIFLVTMLALGVLAASRLDDGKKHSVTWAGLQVSLLAFVVGLFLTGSRTGIALCLVMLVFLGAIVWPWLRKSPMALRWLGGSLGAIIVGSGQLLQLQSVQTIVARFSLTKEARWDLWADAMYASHQVWPFGSGIGTVVPMLEAAERLEVVDTTRPVRVHNDWLEWVLEGGLPGIVILGVILLIVAYLVVRALRTTHQSEAVAVRRAQVIFACGFLMIEALHAVVDYPMRCMSLATIAAVAVALLLEPAAAQRNRQ